MQNDYWFASTQPYFSWVMISLTLLPLCSLFIYWDAIRKKIGKIRELKYAYTASAGFWAGATLIPVLGAVFLLEYLARRGYLLELSKTHPIEVSAAQKKFSFSILLLLVVTEIVGFGSHVQTLRLLIDSGFRQNSDYYTAVESDDWDKKCYELAGSRPDAQTQQLLGMRDFIMSQGVAPDNPKALILNVPITVRYLKIYLEALESYNGHPTNDANAAIVSALSTPQDFEQYVRERGNPNNPTNHLDTVVRKVHVSSIAPYGMMSSEFNNRTASANYEATVHIKESSQGQPDIEWDEHLFIGTQFSRFDLVDVNMAQCLNPVNFKIRAHTAIGQKPVSSTHTTFVKPGSDGVFTTIDLQAIANHNFDHMGMPSGIIWLKSIPFYFLQGNKAAFVTDQAASPGRPTVGVIAADEKGVTAVHLILDGTWVRRELIGKKAGEIDLTFEPGGEKLVAPIIIGTSLREAWEYKSKLMHMQTPQPPVQWQNAEKVQQNRGAPAYAYLDMFSITVPSAFQDKTLHSITIRDTSLEDAGSADPGLYLMGITVEKKRQ